MSRADFATFLIEDSEEPKVIRRAIFWAVVVEATLLTAVGLPGHWLAHPGADANDKSNFIEAEIFQIPTEAHLVEEAKPLAPAKHEMAISKTPNKGHEAKDDEKKFDEENDTQSGMKLAPTHGPVAIFAPAPVIPAYLQDKDLHASVVIDFFVSALGVATPRLVGSSSNEELDAIALQTVKKWQFRAAEKDHHPLDAKVRLRIVFEVK